MSNSSLPIRIVLALTLLITGSAIAAPMEKDSLATDAVDWTLAGLPRVLSSRIHLNATQVPAFPGSPKLRDAAAWPKTMVIGGAICSLRINGWAGDYGYSASSLKKLRAGDGY